MTKTKRQLRAEAVRRLETENISLISFERTILGESCPELDHDDARKYVDGVRDALVELLTDDEPPEGDAVAILRGADDGSVRLKAFAYDPRSLTKLADMVERDYVRRYVHEAKCAEFHAMRDRAWGAEAERDRLKRAAERDADVMDALNVGLSDAEAERDRWKAKAEKRSSDGLERSVTNLEWLYENDEFFNRFARWYAVDRAYAGDDIRADGWLLSEHVFAENGSTPEVADSREKVEADLREFAAIPWHPHGYNPTLEGIAYDDVIALLDRQAAITERESRCDHARGHLDKTIGCEGGDLQ